MRRVRGDAVEHDVLLGVSGDQALDRPPPVRLQTPLSGTQRDGDQDQSVSRKPVADQQMIATYKNFFHIIIIIIFLFFFFHTNKNLSIMRLAGRVQTEDGGND
jgi:hypothetical protein